MTHQLARAAVLVLGLLLLGLAASPPVVDQRSELAGAELAAHDGVVVKRVSHTATCQARPAGTDQPLQLAPLTAIAEVPRPCARGARPARSVVTRPVGLRATCADSRAPPCLP